MPVPNFLIIGAMRSGTTSLAAALGSHPDVYLPKSKELHFFDSSPERSITEYGRYFGDAGGAQAIGEATTTYMYLPCAMDRIHASLPDARLIAILREPVARAYSHYWANLALGREKLSFEAATDTEAARLESGRLERLRYSYLDRGRYRRQLEHAARSIPRERLFVSLFDDLLTSPANFWDQICSFLGITKVPPPHELTQQCNAYQEFRSLKARRLTQRLVVHPGLGRIAAGVLGRANRRRTAYPPIPQDLSRRLRTRFEPELQGLREWLGRDLHEWNNDGEG